VQVEQVLLLYIGWIWRHRHILQFFSGINYKTIMTFEDKYSVSFSSFSVMNLWILSLVVKKKIVLLRITVLRTALLLVSKSFCSSFGQTFWAGVWNSQTVERLRIIFFDQNHHSLYVFRHLQQILLRIIEKRVWTPQASSSKHANCFGIPCTSV